MKQKFKHSTLQKERVRLTKNGKAPIIRVMWTLVDRQGRVIGSDVRPESLRAGQQRYEYVMEGKRTNRFKKGVNSGI